MATESQTQSQPSTPTAPATPVLWLTSRSAFERGTQFCPFARFAEYHAGPYGYGFSRRALSLPLATGTYVHAGIAAICAWILESRQKTGIQPEYAPDDLIRWAASLAVEKYRQVVDKRGLLGLLAATTTEGDDRSAQARAELERTIAEQSALIEGLIWVWSLIRLPQILTEYLIIAIEEEQEYVAGCTCGLGDGIGGFLDHARRTCSGIGLQSRPDLLLERKSDHAWCYTELKTTSVAKKAWNDSYERKQQILLGVLGAEKRHGVEITHSRIEALIKGQRKKDYPFGEFDPKTQQSPLCYGYYEPAVPPLTVGDWLPAYNYYDREGMKHTVPKGRGTNYHRTGIWMVPDDAFPARPDWMSRTEWMVKYLLENYPVHAQKSISPIGPIPKKPAQIEKALRGLVAEERLWQDRLWTIYAWQKANGDKGWGDPDYHAFVEQVIPRSWNCDQWGPDHPCPYQPVCHEQIAGWRDPVGSELYVYRSPHHQAEAEQMAARGLKPEAGLADDQDADDWSGEE